MANSKFHHEEIYLGADLTAKLGKFKIVVCGGGALGSNLLDSLARQGFSDLCVIDMDRVDTHNLNTQTFVEKDIGQKKANALRNRAFEAVGVEVEAHAKELTAGNIKKLTKGAGLVVDCFDNSASRKIIQDFCRSSKIPCLHAGLHTDYGEVVWDAAYTVPADSDEDVCDYPLARNLVTMIVSITSEEIVDFCLNDKPQHRNWCFTLKDMKISPH